MARWQTIWGRRGKASRHEGIESGRDAFWAAGARNVSGLASLEYEIWFAGWRLREQGQPGARRAMAGPGDVRIVITPREPTGIEIVHLHKGCTRLLPARRGKKLPTPPSRGSGGIKRDLQNRRNAIGDSTTGRSPPQSRPGSHPVLGPLDHEAWGTIQGGIKSETFVPGFVRGRGGSTSAGVPGRGGTSDAS